MQVTPTPKGSQIMTNITYTTDTVVLPEGVADNPQIRATYAALLNGVTGSPAQIAAESGVVVARTRAALNTLKAAGVATSVEGEKIGEAAQWSLSETVQEIIAEVEAEDATHIEDVPEVQVEDDELEQDAETDEDGDEPEATEDEFDEAEVDFDEMLAEVTAELAPRLNELATAWDALPGAESDGPEARWYLKAVENANLSAQEQNFPVRSELWFEIALATYASAKENLLDAYQERPERIPATVPMKISDKKRAIAAAIMKAAADLTESWDEMLTGVTLDEFKQYGGLWMSYMAKGVWDDRLGEFPVRK